MKDNFVVGATVYHKKFGIGIIKEQNIYHNNIVLVSFNKDIWVTKEEIVLAK